MLPNPETSGTFDTGSDRQDCGRRYCAGSYGVIRERDDFAVVPRQATALPAYAQKEYVVKLVDIAT